MMLFHDFFDITQTQPEALNIMYITSRNPVKLLKYPPLILLFNSYPTILYKYDQFLIPVQGADIDGRFFPWVLLVMEILLTSVFPLLQAIPS